MLLGLAPALVALSLAGCSAAAPAHPRYAVRVDTLRHGRFGPVVLYRQREHPSQVVLFVSGDGGWNRGVVRMAEELATMDALVVGIDIRHYLRALAAAREPCSYPAADFEALSQWVQQRLGFPGYVPPVLAGYSSGGDAGLCYPGTVATQHLPRWDKPRVLPQPPRDQTVLPGGGARFQSGRPRTGTDVRSGGQRTGAVAGARG